MVLFNWHTQWQQQMAANSENNKGWPEAKKRNILQGRLMIELLYSSLHLYLSWCVLTHEVISDSLFNCEIQQDNCVCCFQWLMSLFTTIVQKHSPGLHCVKTNVPNNVIFQCSLKVLHYIKLSDWTKATAIMRMAGFKQNIFFPLEFVLKI